MLLTILACLRPKTFHCLYNLPQGSLMWKPHADILSSKRWSILKEDVQVVLRNAMLPGSNNTDKLCWQGKW
jgi:hypothetical protein